MRLLAAICGLIVLGACQHVERPEPPEDLISKEKMVDIMTEVYLGNAAKSVNNKVIRQNGLRLDSLIYRKYGVDSMQFVRSNAYYTSRLNDYAEIFEQVEKRLSDLKVRQDSITIPRGRIESDSTRAKELIDPATSN